MKNFKGVAVIGMLLGVCAIFYSPSVGNKDGPKDAQLHSIKYTQHFISRPGSIIIQLATAETTVSFERPATRSTRLLPAPLRKITHCSTIVPMSNSPPKV